MKHLFSILLCFVLTGAALAQSYPGPQSSTVNDFAGLLDKESESRISTQLRALEKETGIEMTVVTLSRQAVFAPDLEFEAFATGLFNAWGVGNRTSNDGILVLVMHADRVMRIELGGAYGRDWDGVAENVVDNSFLPDFKQELYQQGIETGVSAVISRIAKPFHAREEPPKGDGQSAFWAILFAIPIAIFMFFGRIKDRFTRCPQCGKRGIHTNDRVTTSATISSTGQGLRTVTCGHCSYSNSMAYMITKTSVSSGSGFGGGSSGGGGASGKW